MRRSSVVHNGQLSRMEELTRGKRAGFSGLIHANRFLLGSAATACVGSFLYGTDQGVLSNLLTGENFGAHFPDVYTDPVLKGWVVAVLQLGAWAGALINGPLANKISRKYSISVAATVSNVKQSCLYNLIDHSSLQLEVLSAPEHKMCPICSQEELLLELLLDKSHM